MPHVNVELGERLFDFPTFDNWCDTAKAKFKSAGVSGTTIGHMHALCVDQKGRLCMSGREFMRARDDGSFPVVAYRATV